MRTTNSTATAAVSRVLRFAASAAACLACCRPVSANITSVCASFNKAEVDVSNCGTTVPVTLFFGHWHAATSAQDSAPGNAYVYAPSGKIFNASFAGCVHLLQIAIADCQGAPGPRPGAESAIVTTRTAGLAHRGCRLTKEVYDLKGVRPWAWWSRPPCDVLFKIWQLKWRRRSPRHPCPSPAAARAAPAAGTREHHVSYHKRDTKSMTVVRLVANRLPNEPRP